MRVSDGDYGESDNMTIFNLTLISVCLIHATLKGQMQIWTISKTLLM